ncbi:hypothetical protein PCG10_003037 [Penicillium crustosum]|uniref:Uncharacterized protein n=1 Tax=Penicillium crustosum TaxID=36656 RepID=A0A9P5L6L4_PENCR|nr:uncharacterized protein N7487_000789 [Penicillium crustosum]KAF7527210.1 hypothetical protein PCG10_003037 [Penicillium crustosum]KAJ5417239.1 hypothetical protein N7487_000789 [Penicillium crustosum]
METGEIIPGPAAASFSSTSLQTRCERPTDKSGKPLPAVYRATWSLNALFQDFAKLNEVVGKLLTYSNVELEIQSLNWCLTEASQMALNSESRKEEMRNAVQKANDYARMQFQQMQQQGVTQSNAGPPSNLDVSTYNWNSYLRASTALELSPQVIQCTSSVQVEFEAVEG